MAIFSRGQRVMTPRGEGTVAYQRMRSPGYAEAEAVSVVLDSIKKENPVYSGTIFKAEDVRLRDNF